VEVWKWCLILIKKKVGCYCKRGAFGQVLAQAVRRLLLLGLLAPLALTACFPNADTIASM
jgi:hypothetical protein